MLDAAPGPRVEVVTGERTVVTRRSGAKPLLDSWTPERSFTIRLVPPSGTQATAVEMQIPSAWSVRTVGQGGTWDELNHKVKWGPFFGIAELTLSFEASAFRKSANLGEFGGTVSYDGVNRFFQMR